MCLCLITFPSCTVFSETTFIMWMSCALPHKMTKNLSWCSYKSLGYCYNALCIFALRFNPFVMFYDDSKQEVLVGELSGLQTSNPPNVSHVSRYHAVCSLLLLAARDVLFITDTGDCASLSQIKPGSVMQIEVYKQLDELHVYFLCKGFKHTVMWELCSVVAIRMYIWMKLKGNKKSLTFRAFSVFWL